MLLVVTGRALSPLRFKRSQPCKVRIKLGGEKPCAPHLTVRDNVHTGLLLVAQGHIHGIIQNLLTVGKPPFAALGCFKSGPNPCGPRVGAYHTRGQKRQSSFHGDPFAFSGSHHPPSSSPTAKRLDCRSRMTDK